MSSSKVLALFVVINVCLAFAQNADPTSDPEFLKLYQQFLKTKQQNEANAAQVDNAVPSVPAVPVDPVPKNELTKTKYRVKELKEAVGSLRKRLEKHNLEKQTTATQSFDVTPAPVQPAVEQAQPDPHLVPSTADQWMNFDQTTAAPAPTSSPFDTQPLPVAPTPTPVVSDRFHLPTTNNEEFAQPAPVNFPTPVVIGHTQPTPEEQQQARNAHYHFGYVVNDNINGLYQKREEARDGLKVTGMHSYDDGINFVTTQYVADENGFRIIKQEIEPSKKTRSSLNGQVDVSMLLTNGEKVRYHVSKDQLAAKKWV